MTKLIYFFILSILFLTNSCGIYKYSDTRKNPVNANERVQKNIEEGRGFRLGSIGKKGGDFMFASSNPMWRATMQKLSFAPLGVVDYGGGIIITDWFSASIPPVCSYCEFVLGEIPCGLFLFPNGVSP